MAYMVSHILDLEYSRVYFMSSRIVCLPCPWLHSLSFDWRQSYGLAGRLRFFLGESRVVPGLLPAPTG